MKAAHGPRSAVSLVASQAGAGLPMQEAPAWTLAVPALAFLVLAGLAWWFWRHLADDD